MKKDFDTWNKLKKRVHESSEAKTYCREQQIWWCYLGVNIGDEEDGKNELFERPVLILKVFNTKIVWVLPMTTVVKYNKYYFPFKYRQRSVSAIISQLRLISIKRLIRKSGKIDKKTYSKVRSSVKRLLE